MLRDLFLVLGWSAMLLVLVTVAPFDLLGYAETHAAELVIASVFLVFVCPRLMKLGSKRQMSGSRIKG